MADIHEPCSPVVSADSSGYSADNTTWPTADGGLLTGALDFADAEVIAAELPIEGGGGEMVRPQRPALVEGLGFGVLPSIDGDGRGFVGIAGDAEGELLPLAGEADGAVGASGESRGLAGIHAAALGARGSVGECYVTLRAMHVASAGSAAVFGSGAGIIEMQLNAAAVGQHDDEEAAIMTLLLAA